MNVIPKNFQLLLAYILDLILDVDVILHVIF